MKKNQAKISVTIRARPLLKSDLKGKFVEIKVRAYVNYQYTSCVSYSTKII